MDESNSGNRGNAAAFKGIADKLSAQYAQKNMAYGDSFGDSVQKYGLIAALTRLSDKFNRAENIILHPDINVDDERLIDTLGDMASYCIMTIMQIEKDKENK